MRLIEQATAMIWVNVDVIKIPLLSFKIITIQLDWKDATKIRRRKYVKNRFKSLEQISKLRRYIKNGWI